MLAYPKLGCKVATIIAISPISNHCVVIILYVHHNECPVEP